MSESVYQVRTRESVSYGTIFTFCSTASFSSYFFILEANQDLMSTVGNLPSFSDILCFMLGVEMVF
jgi:hypothetical protein